MEDYILGTFNGETMDGDNMRQYPVPSNYASKSKLVVGDRLKLIISESGLFTYKQIEPIERRNIIAKVVWDEILGKIMFLAPDGTYYKVLPASVTFYQPEVGDEAVLIVPRGTFTEWAALDGIITAKKNAL